MAMLLGGYALVYAFQYGIVASVLAICAAIGIVAAWERISRRRSAEKIRRILLARRLPVNVEASGSRVTSAQVDAWLMFHGNPKGMAIDLTNRLIWVLFEERRIRALRPSAVSSFELRDETALGGTRRRCLELLSHQEPSMRFRILDGDEQAFSAAMTLLLRPEGSGAH
jgi:hypothetical protein